MKGIASLCLFDRFLRHRQKSLNNIKRFGERHQRPLPFELSIFQCYLHPAIPRQVAPQQSLTPFYQIFAFSIFKVKIQGNLK